MATSGKASKKAPAGGGMSPKIVMAALGIAAISSLSSFVAIRLAMPRQVIIEKHIVTEKGNVVEGKHEEKGHEAASDVYQVGDFTVNLADPGSHHLKTSVTLLIQAEVKEDKKGEGGGGHGGGAKKDPGAEVRAEMAPYEPLYKDVIISALSHQTIARLQSPNGKDLIKDEIKVALNKAVPSKKVVGVYFTDFVFQ